MSNVDLLEDHEAKSAHAQGWQLCHVFDACNRTTRPQILPLAFTRPFDTSEKAARLVINRKLPERRQGRYEGHQPGHERPEEMNAPPPRSTVARKELNSWRMVSGNEDTYPVVIDGGRRKDWVAIGWIDVGPATDLDLATYPVVVDPA